MLRVRKTLLAMLIMVVLLLLGFGMVRGIKMIMMEIEPKSASMDTGIVIAALLVPLLAYAILSGAIEELGFGGWNAKFSRAASEVMNVDLPGQMTLDHDAFGILNEFGHEGAGEALEKMLIKYDLSEANPIVLNIILGNLENNRERLVDVVRRLSLFRSFKLIVFLDQAARVKAFMPSWVAMKFLSDEKGKGEKFISAITGNDVDKIDAFDHVVTTPLSVNDSNAEALRRMMRMDFEAFAVVDCYSRLKAVVERDDVVSKMMLALVEK